MLSFIIRRILIIIPMMIAVSIICFALTELQPGDYTTQYLSNPRISPQQIEKIREDLNLDKSAPVRYMLWIKGVVVGDFGYSFAHKRPVSELINERIWWTIAISLSTYVLQWLIAVPLGIFSAYHPYTKRDYALTFVSFVGVSMPEFFIALIMVFIMLFFGASSVGGLFSTEFIGVSMSFAKFIDLLKHIWLPIIVIGIPGVTSLLRVMRGNLLDTMQQPFVESMRARGLGEKKVRKHILKNALNPMVSIAGMQLPMLFSGTIIAAIVLNLPTMGPFFYKALLSQDQYLVMAFLMLIAFITQVANIISDIALAMLDPRIKLN